MMSQKEINDMLREAGKPAKKPSGWEEFGKASALIGLVIGNVLVGAWSLTVLWRWFVLALFPGAPTLTIPIAIGFDMLVFCLRPIEPGDKKYDAGELIAKGFGRIIGYNSFVLGIGYLAHLFVR